MKIINKNNNQPYPKDQSVPLENLKNIGEKIEPGRYILHPTGGPHYFKGVKSAPKKFQEDIWPWIEDTFPAERIGLVVLNGNKRMNPFHSGIGHNFYTKMTLYPKIDPNWTSKEIQNKRFQLEVHTLIVAAYCENLDPSKYISCDHINRDRQDYRIENLRWVTAKENATGHYKASHKTKEQVFAEYMTMFGDRIIPDGQPRYEQGMLL